MSKYLGECTVTLGEDSFDLRYNMQAIAEFEDLMGTTIGELFSIDAAGEYDEHQLQKRLMSARFAIALLLAGMKYNPKYRGVNKAKAGKLLDRVGMVGMMEVLDPMVTAFMRPFGVDLTKTPEPVEDTAVPLDQSPVDVAD